jgi:hypothetical protein
MMNKRQQIRYALYAAKLALANFPPKHPDRDQLCSAVKALAQYLKKPSSKGLDDLRCRVVDMQHLQNRLASVVPRVWHVQYTIHCVLSAIGTPISDSMMNADSTVYAAVQSEQFSGDRVPVRLRILRYGVRLLTEGVKK